MKAARRQRRQSKLDALVAPIEYDAILRKFQAKHCEISPTMDELQQLAFSLEAITEKGHVAHEHKIALCQTERLLAEVRQHESSLGGSLEYKSMIAHLISNVGAGIFAMSRFRDEFNTEKELPRIRSLYREAATIWATVNDQRMLAKQLDMLLDVCRCSAVFAHEGPLVFDELEPIKHFLDQKVVRNRAELFAECRMSLNFAVGQRVELCNLNRTELNGLVGILGWEKDGGRFPVTLDDGRKIGVKLGNFFLIINPPTDIGPRDETRPMIVVTEEAKNAAERAGCEAGLALLEERDIACFLLWDSAPATLQSCSIVKINDMSTFCERLGVGMARCRIRNDNFMVCVEPKGPMLVVKRAHAGDWLALLVLHRLRSPPELRVDWELIESHGLRWSADHILGTSDEPSSPESTSLQIRGHGSNRRYQSILSVLNLPELPRCKVVQGATFTIDHRMIRASRTISESADLTAVEALARLPLDGPGAASRLCNVNLIRQCANCGADDLQLEQPPFKACSRCRDVVYCCRECQKAHWKAHKLSCTETAVDPDSLD